MQDEPTTHDSCTRNPKDNQSRLRKSNLLLQRIVSLYCFLIHRGMIFSIVSNGRSFCSRINENRKGPLFLHSNSIILSSQHQTPKANNSMNRYWKRSKPYYLCPLIGVPERLTRSEDNKSPILKNRDDFTVNGCCQQMIVLCGIGYFVNGFRCFPLLGLNFHMASSLRLDPSVLQVVQIAGTLPMVAKPLYGILSDALSIGGAHRIPWISVGILLQVLSWGLLALIPCASKALPALIASVLLSNAGASIAEFAKDALVVEYGQSKQIPGLQSYAFMAIAAGGILGNLLGGFFLLQTQNPKSIFLAFVALLAFQLTLTLPTREESVGVRRNTNELLVWKSILKSIKEQYNMLIMMVISDKRISFPLLWAVASVMTVPILSGAIFCYQTQTLNLDPSVIGMSKVIGQLMLLALTVMYDRFWKRIPMRKLIGTVQIIYALSVLLDLVLVNQLNLKLGISNERFALCFSGVAEIIAQFKLLPFLVLFASLAPSGCEGSLMSILASALCLSSMISSFFGVGLASLLGITSGNYSSLPFGILIQFLAALLPIMWINLVPEMKDSAEEEKKQAVRKKSKNRVKRLSFEYDPMIYSYIREKEPDLWG